MYGQSALLHFNSCLTSRFFAGRHTLGFGKGGSAGGFRLGLPRVGRVQRGGRELSPKRREDACGEK